MSAALEDLRVIEMGQLLAGPFAGQLFADFGADVVKLEPPGVGDPMREWGREKPHGKSLWWPIVARGKRSVTCDLRTPEGQQIVRDLVGKADVLIENFRPGTLERWNLSPDLLWKINPMLVILRVSGFGQTGPKSTQAGFFFCDVENIENPLAGARLVVTGIRNSAGKELFYFEVPLEKYLGYKPPQ